MHENTSASPDYETLLKLNGDYIRSVQSCDVATFSQILAPDFLCTNADGSLVDRAGFLQQTAHPISIRDLAVHDVNVRILGDVAIIHARTTYSRADGGKGSGRYTDVWRRQGNTWRAVAAHVSRN
jgi:ketosteroid isomerase-like protein